MANELLHDIDLFIEQNQQAIFRDIARLVAIDSVEGEPEEGAPFGSGPKMALEKGLEIAEELGLKAVNCENKIGYAQLGGDDDRYLATITHLDVVPVGEGWKEDPFTMRDREGYIIGRGVLDDKGPSVICLYALKFLRERGIALKYPIRALLGANEETGMKDVEHYLANYPAPLFCFSPDADFPLCNGEKGIFHGRIVSKIDLDRIVDLKGGVAYNAIPDKAEALVKAEKLPNTDSVEAQELEPGLWHLLAHGVGGHAAHPQGTVNAIGQLLEYLLANDAVRGEEKKLIEAIALLHRASDGSALGVQADDGLFEPLTIVGGIICVEDGHIVQTVDSRYPTNTSGKKIAAGIREKLGELAEILEERDTEPFYMSLDNPAVQVCINSYNAVTGENAKPFTIGGGTYARDFPNAVSFGPEHQGRPRPDFVGPIHGVDEAASKAELLEAMKIYILALIELEKLEF